MNAKNIFKTLLLVFSIAGCQIEKKANTEYNIYGQELGPRTFVQIDEKDSKVSFVGEDPIKRVEILSLKDRYSERITFKNNGTMRYGKLFFGGFSNANSDADLIQDALNSPFFEDRGIVFDKNKIKRVSYFSYLIQSSATDTCFIYRGVFGDQSVARGDQEVFGGLCYGISKKSANSLENEMVDILTRARFGTRTESAGVSPSPAPATTPIQRAESTVPLVPLPVGQQVVMSDSDRKEFIKSCGDRSSLGMGINQTSFCECLFQMIPIYVPRVSVIELSAQLAESKNDPRVLDNFPALGQIKAMCLRQQK